MDRLERTIIELGESGLVPQSQVETVIRGLSTDQQPAEEGELLDALHASQLLTDYQLQEAKHGKIRELVLGNYLILERIGKGGMGVVFKARHRQMDRVVAIKVMSPAMLSSDLAKARFRQEVRNAAKVLHPNIVVAFDAGEANGVQYLAMEYIAGENLSQVVRRKGSFSVERALSAVAQAARGLEHAHASGMVHRDIKPGNLLLDESGVVKVLDLGLARFAPAVHAVDAADYEALTSEGDVLGTIDYMAPEQAVASSEVDGRADIYSLGATLYFLLTGRPLYPGGNVVEKLLAHRERTTPSVSDVRPEVPPIVDQLLMTMLAKDPAERFQTMRELLHELERIAQQLSVADNITPIATATTVGFSPRPTHATPKRRRGTPQFQAVLLWATLGVIAVTGLSYEVGNWWSRGTGQNNGGVVADGHQQPAVSSPGDVVAPTGPVEPMDPKQLDFVIVIDASATMLPTLSRMAGIMPYFESRLRDFGYDSQFAIVAFGHREEQGSFNDRHAVNGRPRLMHPLTSVGEFSLRLQEMFDPETAELYPGPIELGSLALREAANDVFGETSVLYRSASTPIIVLITDEDDDSDDDDFLLARAALTHLDCRLFAFCRSEESDIYYGNTDSRYGVVARECGGSVFSIAALIDDPRSSLDSLAESVRASVPGTAR